MNHSTSAHAQPMNIDPVETEPSATPRIWAVGALCRMIAQVLNARLNPVAVRGEISGFSRASSGHCYFTLKDEAALATLSCGRVEEGPGSSGRRFVLGLVATKG